MRDDFLREPRPTPAGSREAHARLVEELEAHLEDSAACEGEAEALARLGTTRDRGRLERAPETQERTDAAKHGDSVGEPRLRSRAGGHPVCSRWTP